MAAAYVGQELQSEFGKIPPSFLPLGNKRLYQYQKALAPDGVSVYMTVPASYDIPIYDQDWLRINNVEVVKIPDDISLGASLVAALNLVEPKYEEPLHIIFGDTLFKRLPEGNDILCVSESKSAYDWAVVSNEKKVFIVNNDSHLPHNNIQVVNGYFKFTDLSLLVKCITESQWNFIEGINRYHIKRRMNISMSDSWYDFGHVNNYYRSKAEFTTQRAFNELTICSEWVEKSSLKNDKIEAEANWFKMLPERLRGFTPQFLGYTKDKYKTSYRLEYLHQTALNELYVYSELPTTTWEQVIDATIKFLKACRYESVPNTATTCTLYELLELKTINRLKEYCHKSQITMNDNWYFNNESPVSIDELLELSDKHLPKSDQSEISVLHGDFCFSNILYDFRADRIKTIDPRGVTEKGVFSIYGDIRYDLAKLSHSVLGMYDWIIAGFYNITIENNQIDFYIYESEKHQQIQQVFIEKVAKEFGLESKALIAMQIRLFLSMLPLHSDDTRRQQALFANSFRLYFALKRLVA